MLRENAILYKVCTYLMKWNAMMSFNCSSYEWSTTKGQCTLFFILFHKYDISSFLKFKKKKKKVIYLILVQWQRIFFLFFSFLEKILMVCIDLLVYVYQEVFLLSFLSNLLMCSLLKPLFLPLFFPLSSTIIF